MAKHRRIKFLIDNGLRGIRGGRRTYHWATRHLIRSGARTRCSATTCLPASLRQYAEGASQYAALKRTLETRYPADRVAYTDGKAAFIVDTHSPTG